MSRRITAKVKSDERLMLVYLITLAFGLVMVYSASSITAASRHGSQWFFLRQQLAWAVLSLIVIFVLTRVDLKRFAPYSAPALFLTIFVLPLVFLMEPRNDAYRWLQVGPLTLQPSELFKFLMIMYLAFSLSNPRRNLADPRQMVVPYAPIIGTGLLLILLEPDLGACIVICLTVLGMFFLAGARVKHIMLATLPPAALGSFVVFVLGYKSERIYQYLASVLDPLTGGYQVKQAALTFGSGGWLGVGLGDGRQKLFFLPYPHTDFIFASIGEEVGLIGLIAVLAMLAFLIYSGCRIAIGQPDRFGFLLAAGMTWSLFVNIAINIGAVTSLLPVTGRALPFFSYGGSSLIVSSAAIGVLLNLSRRVEAR